MTVQEVCDVLESLDFGQIPANWCDALYEAEGTCIEVVGTPGGFARMLGNVFPEDHDDSSPNLYRHHIPRDANAVSATAQHWMMLDNGQWEVTHE